MNSAALFERSRRKIIAAIMGVLVLLFAATLAAIYAFSYAEVYDRDSGMLEEYASSYQRDRMPKQFERSEAMRSPKGDPGRQSAPFYAVLLDDKGESVAVENANASGYSEDELVSLAQEAVAEDARTGVLGNLMYAIDRGQGYVLVAFMDNTLVTESMGTLFRYTFIVGLVALIALFFVARWLAGRIVSPMQRAYEAQRRFISDAGHDLKTPVAIVETNAELLERQIGSNQWLENIRHENNQLGILVAQLLELAHAEEQPSERTSVDLSRLSQAEVLSYEPVAFEHGMTLISTIEEGIHVKGNAAELTRLISILLDNAVSHGTADQPITLALSHAGHHERLTVQNAIRAEDVEHLQNSDIFSRFSRGNDARTSSDDAIDSHYGLGLAIARAIVSSHNGTIQADIDAHALSITFIVTI